jgi:hypothetical protein
MNTHAHRPLARRQANLTPLGRFAAWVNTRWQARRARRLEEETVACLSTMDVKLLNDIGVDFGKLGDAADTPMPRRRASNRRKLS